MPLTPVRFGGREKLGKIEKRSEQEMNGTRRWSDSADRKGWGLSVGGFSLPNLLGVDATGW